jgi:iron complex transport system permease protein
MDVAIAVGQGLGLAVACGLAAFLPLGVGAVAAILGLLPGALAVFDDTIVALGGWLAGVAQAAVTTLVSAPVRVVLAALGGAAAFHLAAGDELPWAGLALGAVVGAVTAWVASRVIDGATGGEGTASGVAMLVGAAALVVAVVAIVPAVGYLLPAVVGWFGLRARRGAQRKYAGLRVLR